MALDSSASGGVGPHELVEGDIRSPDLDLGDPRLCGADALAELLLGEAVRLALPTNGESQRESKLDELSLFGGEPEKIRRLSNPPAGGRKSLSSLAPHGHGVTVRLLCGTLLRRP